MSNLLELLKTEFSRKILEAHAEHGDETIVISKETLLEIAQCLKTDPRFSMNVLMDLTAVDGLEMKWKPRFEVVYHFYSLSLNHRLRVKVRVEEREAVVPSLVSLWPIANWLEREAWDMFGIRFEGHPDLKRILMYDEFVGHPLRKDYPITKRQPLIGPKN